MMIEPSIVMSAEIHFSQQGHSPLQWTHGYVCH